MSRRFGHGFDVPSTTAGRVVQAMERSTTGTLSPTQPSLPAPEEPNASPVKNDGSTPTDATLARDFVQHAPAEVKPMIAAIAPGTYRLKGGWSLLVEPNRVVIDKTARGGDTVNSGQIELRDGSTAVLLSYAAVAEHDNQPDQASGGELVTTDPDQTANVASPDEAPEGAQ